MKANPFRLCCGALCLLLPVLARAVDDLTISGSTTYSTTTTETATNSITTSSSGSGVTVGSAGNVTFRAPARITLAAGFKVNAGGLFRTSTGQALTYTAGFETGEGFSLGSIALQRGWQVSSGTAAITTTDNYGAGWGLGLAAGGAPAIATQGFISPGTSPNITFLQLYLKPVAAATAASSTLVLTESSRVGFQVVNGQGEIYLYDGVGANQWVATGYRFPLTSAHLSANWLRLTLRLDYAAKKWDLWCNDTLGDYDLAFESNSETFLRWLTLQGVTAVGSSADAITISGTNPLFPDSDKDGLPDAWESANGLSTATDDRNGDVDSDGWRNIEEYYAGTKANNADVTKPSTPAGLSNTSSTPTTLAMSWSASSDSGSGTPGIAGYHVYRNGVRVNASLIATPTVAYTDINLLPSTTYVYTVRAVDVAGNLSDPSAAVLMTTSNGSSSGTFEIFTPLL